MLSNCAKSITPSLPQNYIRPSVFMPSSFPIANSLDLSSTLAPCVKISKMSLLSFISPFARTYSASDLKDSSLRNSESYLFHILLNLA